ncbi:MAG: gamma-glutamyl-gamma-aminobutyrate hydrolase family protein [Pseudomonadota bacterium]
MSNKPRIGITLDFVDPAHQPEGAWFNLEPWYALRYRYATAVEMAGGLPLNLSYHMNLIDDYVDILDGLLITGGGFDVDPMLYGAKTVHPTVLVKHSRTAFETALCKAFLAAGKPILGVCGGMQLLNVVFGGTLHQHLPDTFIKKDGLDVNHNPKMRAFLTAHNVTLIADTKLAALCSTDSYGVNSVHHQAVDRLGSGLKANAIADDTLIEAFESTEHSFVVGIQWHPEFLLSELDINIFKSFIESASS